MVYHRRKHCIHDPVRDIRRTGEHHKVFHIVSKKAGEPAIFKSNYNTTTASRFIKLRGCNSCKLSMKGRRYTVLQHAMRAEDCDVVAAFEPENVFYLTGFWGEAIAVCIDSGRT